ncbi:MAG: cysteine-rich small domain-containing protein [Lachnospiraceae bacterium]|nr:cysteine-rich small domain-containing protein [Lachnospiraceae bacterium]
MENSYKFFENRDCKYFPCHKGLKDFNCMFCYCPMYSREKCLGNPSFVDKGDRKIKDCSKCVFPHIPENYEKIMQFLKECNQG